MGHIKIRNLHVPTLIGIYEHERTQAQDIYVSLEIEVSNEASTTDDIADALDYDALCKSIRDEVATTRFYLIERLAAFILELVVQHPLALNVTVCVSKPAAVKEAETIEFQLSTLH